MPEMVFLLGRMGNNREALMLIIQRLNDVERVRSWLPLPSPILTGACSPC